MKTLLANAFAVVRLASVHEFPFSPCDMDAPLCSIIQCKTIQAYACFDHSDLFNVNSIDIFFPKRKY
uniref:Secreted protein n=1 Tax=Panagrolaimus sp. ES5 TaxID=591445 RepID=A0AC34F9K8_9BILA